MRIVCTCFLHLLTILPLISCIIVETNVGAIRGIDRYSRKGVRYDAFMGIPYAEAPIGNLRFQPPVRKNPWQGVLNATSYGPICMQNPIEGNKFPISEDCLHLNVFTRNTLNLKPVLVFIHGGSFELGSSSNHEPDYLMDRDIVLVTINYRVGAFGFLATGTSKAMGNMGLKDQVMALKWINENIVYFGGDSQQVTISGLSAGGFSVSSHLVSDMSQGLFSRAIIMSGSITWMSRMRRDNKELASFIADKVNCTSQDVVECLQEIPAKEILAVKLPMKYSCVVMTWNPVIEDDFGQQKFLTENPLDTFRGPSSRFKDIRIMVGLTHDEIIYISPYILSDPDTLRKMENDLSGILYECFYAENISQDTSMLKEIYLPFDEVDKRSFEGIGKLASDGLIGYGSHRLVHLLSNITDVYYYKFSYTGQYSVFNYPRKAPYGVTHADDIQYIFNTWYVAPLIEESHRDNFMVERMTRIWEQFVWRGNPNNNSDQYLQDMVWPKHNWNDEFYLDIGTHMVEKNGLFLERFVAWERMFNENY